MTRHSNMVVFGTNTVVGVRVGTNATQVPSIDIGYTRQEAVLMPIVANTGITKGQNQTGQLTPCNIGGQVAVVAGNPPPPAGAKLPEFAHHPCLLVASDGRNAKDSYSVLASFGADFAAGAEPSKSTAKGGLAQYFATGMAAQLLALNGGAAVVATGQAAEKAAESPPLNLSGEKGLAAAFGASTLAEPSLPRYLQFIGDLSIKIDSAASDALAVAGFAKFKAAANIPAGGLACTDKSSCKAAISGSDDLYQLFVSKGDVFMRQALAQF